MDAVRELDSSRCLVFRKGMPPAPVHDVGEVSDILKETDAVVWLDLCDPTAVQIDVLHAEFGLHPLALEDATTAHERPKADAYPEYWVVVVHGITGTADGFVVHEMTIFAAHRFVVTVRHSPLYPLGQVEHRWLQDDNPMRHDSATLLYLLLDTIVEDYSNVADGFVRRVAEIEEVLFGGGHSPREFLQEVFSMRNDLRRFRRSIAPMREILTSIIHSPGDIFKADEVAYYRDVRDHAVRAIDEIDAAGDAVSSALDMQFRLENQRQGDVVKQLTVIATIFLPLTFITGFFGQNFGWLVTNIASLPTFLVFGIVLEIATVASLLLWFKVKRWL